MENKAAAEIIDKPANPPTATDADFWRELPDDEDDDGGIWENHL